MVTWEWRPAGVGAHSGLVLWQFNLTKNGLEEAVRGSVIFGAKGWWANPCNALFMDQHAAMRAVEEEVKSREVEEVLLKR